MDDTNIPILNKETKEFTIGEIKNESTDNAKHSTHLFIKFEYGSVAHIYF